MHCYTHTHKHSHKKKRERDANGGVADTSIDGRDTGTVLEGAGKGVKVMCTQGLTLV